VLWCQTVISSVQGRTISTIARMSRLFGISKTDWTHSSSLPDSENPRDRTAEHMENRNKWARRNKDRERTRERERAVKATRLIGLTSAYNPPIAEAGLEGPQLLGPGAAGHFYRTLLELPAGTSGTHLEGNLQHKAKVSRQRKVLGSCSIEFTNTPEEEQVQLGQQATEMCPTPPGRDASWVSRALLSFASTCLARPLLQLSKNCSVLQSELSSSGKGPFTQSQPSLTLSPARPRPLGGSRDRKDYLTCLTHQQAL